MRKKKEARELYQGHGDHIGAILPARIFMEEFLGPLINGSAIYKVIETPEGKATSLRFDKDTCSFLSIIKENKKENCNEFVTIYPYLDGVRHKVVIDEVLEWENGLEATVCGHIDEFEFAFFATDYYLNKELYKKGGELPVYLCALGIRVERGQSSFSFEGQQAIDWLAKMGRKPTYDKNGNVEPVHFSLKNLVICANTDEKAPDEFEFHSPIVGEIHKVGIIGIPFNVIPILIKHDEDTEIPLYYQEEMFKDPRQGDTAQGYLWMMGRVENDPRPTDH